MNLHDVLLDMAEHDFGPDEPHRVLLLSLAGEIRRLHAHAEAMAVEHVACLHASPCPCTMCRVVAAYRRDYPGRAL